MNTLKSKYLIQFFKSRKLSKETQRGYNIIMKQFCEVNNKNLDDLVEELIVEQYDEIRDNKIIKFNPETGKMVEYINRFVEYSKSHGNKNNTIYLKISKIKAFMNYYNIRLPDVSNFKIQTPSWNKLSKSEIKYAIDTSDLFHRTLILFLTSTGMRISDVVNIRIVDFMKVTSDYHNLNNVDDFIELAPDDMVGFWDFKPVKTSRHNIQCKVCNTPEASNNILLLLRERKKFYIKRHPELKLEENDFIFASRNNQYKQKLFKNSITSYFNKLNKRLQTEIKRELKSKLEDGGITEYTYNKMLDEAPRLSAHGLRKYFISTAAENVGNLRVCALMEGHAAPMGLDDSYVKISDDLIKEEYHKLIEPLSFENTEVNFITSRKRKELEEEIDELKKENRNIRSEMEDEIARALHEALDRNISNRLKR